ncbi:MAG: hypothetical protein N2047_05690 [Meiothermus sp.]|nr:hypothetical protein [Meiothermus sp.]
MTTIGLRHPKRFSWYKQASQPLFALEPPPAEHGLRVLALRALAEGRFEMAFFLAEAALQLPFEAAEAAMRSENPQERALQLLRAPEIPKRLPHDLVSSQSQFAARLWQLVVAGNYLGHLEKDLHYYQRLLQGFRERDLRVARTFIKEGLRFYTRVDLEGKEQVDPIFFRGFEGFLVTWRSEVMPFGKESYEL